MGTKTILAALAAAALMTGEAQAATIYSQNFNAGLNINEQTGGNFGVSDGTMGHQTIYYGNNEYSYYQVRLDLTNAIDALMTFDFNISSEGKWDGLNLVYSTGGLAPSTLLRPMVESLYDELRGPAGALMGPEGISGVQKGRAMFDLNPLVGQVVDIRFQFMSDTGVIGAGFDMDNLLVQGTVMSSAVPEPATWAMMIAGFGLMATAIRRRRVAAFA